MHSYRGVTLNPLCVSSLEFEFAGCIRTSKGQDYWLVRLVIKVLIGHDLIGIKSNKAL
jgi:hypothetical protein